MTAPMPWRPRLPKVSAAEFQERVDDLIGTSDWADSPKPVPQLVSLLLSVVAVLKEVEVDLYTAHSVIERQELWLKYGKPPSPAPIIHPHQQAVADLIADMHSGKALGIPRDDEVERLKKAGAL